MTAIRSIALALVAGAFTTHVMAETNSTVVQRWLATLARMDAALKL